jgi:hypothetical protein
MMSAALRMSRARSHGGTRRHFSKPRSAEASAASRSSTVATGMVPMTSSLVGSMTSLTAPSLAGRQAPSK